MKERRNGRTSVVVEPPLNEAEVPSVAQEIACATDRAPVEAIIPLLESEDSARIALYLPERWLPDRPGSAYAEAYVEAWWSLLGQVDQRADFVDGDIGELYDENPVPLVVKAMHLIPWLQERGLVSERDIRYVLSQSDRDLLRESFMDCEKVASSNRLTEQTTLGEMSPARRKWLAEVKTDELVREMARSVEPNGLEELMCSHEPIEVQIAMAALGRMLRSDKFSGIEQSHEAWLGAQLSNDDIAVRQRAERTYRHLSHAGVLSRDLLESRGVATPALAGDWSENLCYMQTEVTWITEIIERISSDERLLKLFYPVVTMGGSRLKGYGNDDSDLDLAVMIRPGALEADVASSLESLFGDERPIQCWLSNTPEGLRLPSCEADIADRASDAWSHLLYNNVWIGERETIEQLRKELTAPYENDPTLRRIALRRLEQDALQYRLMHKGYERHYVVDGDDRRLERGGVDRQSVYWDPGYRRLAAQLFAEKIRLQSPPKK